MSELQLATFGAGCFWCVEAVFSSLKGVEKVQSGYSGGQEEDASYKLVCSGMTNHAEVVQISFNPELISFETLIEVFFQSHDPTTLNRQGNDKGPQYRSAIFYHSQAQADAASLAIAKLNASGLWRSPVVTELTAYTSFFAAENYHDDYFALNGHQPYCQMVIKPKVDKVREVFEGLIK